MPIKDWSKYPKNWKSEIRPAILKRANHCCEKCGVDNYAVVYWDKELKQWERMCGNKDCDAAGNGELPYIDARVCADLNNEAAGFKVWKVICLTIAHLDHDISNNDYSNLSALCQRCHLNLDAAQHKQNAKETLRKKKGLQELF